MEQILIESFASFIAVFAFAFIFNIRGKFITWAAIGGFLSWFFYKVALLWCKDVNLAMFISAIIFSSYSELLARKLKTPVTVLVVCGLMPLVPGSGMYYTMSSAVHGETLNTWNLAVSTLSSAGSLALGVIFVSTITRLILNFKNNTYSRVKAKFGPRTKIKTKNNKKES
ncbi:threonine/serine exporter family protein [Clostridium mediterraneense]|uniref:threonine/serine exporter family protein n=1 Tax=Clostridium mediterraneense TaxID=1805472 RepID=UPI00082F9981|nr:threonine/serine exporter family protein [Clostridium mediterraneense]